MKLIKYTTWFLIIQNMSIYAMDIDIDNICSNIRPNHSIQIRNQNVEKMQDGTCIITISHDDNSVDVSSGKKMPIK